MARKLGWPSYAGVNFLFHFYDNTSPGHLRRPGTKAEPLRLERVSLTLVLIIGSLVLGAIFFGLS